MIKTFGRPAGIVTLAFVQPKAGHLQRHYHRTRSLIRPRMARHHPIRVTGRTDPSTR
jgi:hypothetical protein